MTDSEKNDLHSLTNALKDIIEETIRYVEREQIEESLFALKEETIGLIKDIEYYITHAEET